MKWIKKLFCGNTEATPSNIEAHKDEIKVPVSFLSAQNIVYAGEEVGLSWFTSLRHRQTPTVK